MLVSKIGTIFVVAASASAYAEFPISGVWQTSDGTLLALVRDTAGLVVGLEMDSALKAKNIYSGMRLRTGLSMGISSLDQQRNIAITIGDGVISGTATDATGGSKPFSATRVLSYTGSDLDGIWKRDDGDKGYLFIFNGTADNGGLGVAAEIFFKNGVPQHFLSVGKVTGKTFADTTTGALQLTLKADGKLYGNYAARVLDKPSTSEAGYSAIAGGAFRATTAVAAAGGSTSGPTTYTATRLVAGQDPDVTAKTTGGVARKGCNGDFGDLQKQIKTSINASLAESGTSPGWVLSRQKIGDVTVYDGGSVPNYRITYVTDASKNLGQSLKKASLAQNVYVQCGRVTAAQPLFVTASQNTVGADATTFCDSVQTSAADLSPMNAAFSARGMNAEAIAFTPVDTSATTSGKVTLQSTIAIDTDNTVAAASAGETEAYAKTASLCKGWYPSGATPTSTYPSWYSSKPSGTPEFSVCIDPSNNIGTVPGIFAIDIKHGNSATSQDSDATLKLTTEVNLGTVVPYQFKVVDPSTGKTTYLETQLPEHLTKAVSGASDVVDPLLSAFCYYDTEAEKWFGINVGGVVKEPHLEACKAFNSQFLAQFKTGAYNGFYVNKSTVSFPNGDTMEITPADAMSVGMGLMAGAGLGALGIGAFQPSGNLSGSGVSAEAQSKVKFISVSPSFSSTIQSSCEMMPADPETGEPAYQDCTSTTTTQPAKLIAYTIEAPSCE